MNVKKILSIILVLVWMSIVFYFSNQQGEGSSSMSKNVSEIIVNIIDIQNTYTDSKKDELIQIIEPWIRKLAHYTIYTIGGILIANSTIQFHKKEKSVIVISSLIGIMYAISDEIHQLMVSGRSGNIKDVIIDSLGILTGIAFFLLVGKIVQKITSAKAENKGGE